MKINHREDPIPHRRTNYPSVGDQLDAIYKGFLALEEQGWKLHDDTHAWLRTISAIKATFPVKDNKPSG